eukprot:Clim_evm51s152 gene=Clim_evmTU51s152
MVLFKGIISSRPIAEPQSKCESLPTLNKFIMPAENRVINFSAGPAQLPLEVLKEAQEDLVSYKGCGMSVMEMSHRGKEYSQIHSEAEQDLRDLLNIPDNYKVLFLQGGATTHFASIPMNFLGEKKKADYIITGNWSKKAVAEAKKYCEVNEVIQPKLDAFNRIPEPSTWKLDPEAAYVYYCMNETVYGVEFPYIPETNGVPLIADVSSTFLSRPIDVSKFACIYGGAQKNIGPSGVTIIIIREDFLGKALPITPDMLNYKIQADNSSLFNTPPCWAIYVSGLVFKWLKKNGGLEKIGEINQKKAEALYELIDNSNGFYVAPVEKASRSWMNVPFRVKNDADLEAKFLKEAQVAGMVQLKGHRSVGGIRASIYNAVSLDQVNTLIAFMKKFMADNP